MCEEYLKILTNNQNSIGDRYFAIFQLKNICTQASVQGLIYAYPSCGASVLLKHQLLYALGQLSVQNYSNIKSFLIAKIQDQAENALSRHQAAEALANYFDSQLISLYQKHLGSQCKQLKYTCEIALQKLKDKQTQNLYGLDYNGTKQPAAPYSQAQFCQIKQKHKAQDYLQLLLNPNLTLYQKYRVMYYMRNRKSKKCIETLCSLLSKKYYKTQCSLLKHQICFIIGQIGCEGFEECIRECIENQDEEEIVRHEALAAVASQSKDLQYLEKFVQGGYGDLIKQSAQVAIHSIKYWNQ